MSHTTTPKSLEEVSLHYQLEVVQQLCELKQPLFAGGLPVVARQAVQLPDVGGSQFIKMAPVLRALHWHCEHKHRTRP